ncbi:hypothetical protein Curi_c28660 [Gottschalkia acidurici 9a]|uniref:Outer membrane protein assembly factor BamB n=1 Tax=Gottschalkia acidurici (strain ATCC 7906 / DSM 604 / BCRC 14475 / CIP 104303 / KCTC 5404 / NCIMB 10678 / 9a) TaxID=1128398 RepID=K0B1J0_GOTA9|nr:DUF5711 family protein [Gottschalkia acidurici]AFS79853.1 hypothetical protein Curi_c28660 [Gottschalkia acidurici 9a]
MTSKTKVNKRRASISLISFIILIFTITLVKEKIEDITSVREKKLINRGHIEVNWNEKINMKGYDDSVMITDDGKLVSYSFDNQKNWHRNIDEDKEIVCLGEKGIYIGDKEKGNIDKIDIDGKKIWSYDTKYPIYTISENQEYLFIYSKVNEDIRRITILDQNGNEVLSNDKNNKEILSANVSQDKNNYIVTDIDKKSTELKSDLTYLDNKGNIVWEKDLEKKLIYNTLFLDNKKMVLVEDKQIICIDNKGKVLWSKDIDYNLKDIKTLGSKEIYILYGDKNTNLEVLDNDGDRKYKKTFNKIYNQIIIDNDDIILAGDEELLGIKKEKINLKYRIKEKAKKVDKANNKVFIFTNNKIDIFEIVSQ